MASRQHRRKQERNRLKRLEGGQNGRPKVERLGTGGLTTLDGKPLIGPEERARLAALARHPVQAECIRILRELVADGAPDVQGELDRLDTWLAENPDEVPSEAQMHTYALMEIFGRFQTELAEWNEQNAGIVERAKKPREGGDDAPAG